MYIYVYVGSSLYSVAIICNSFLEYKQLEGVEEADWC